MIVILSLMGLGLLGLGIAIWLELELLGFLSGMVLLLVGATWGVLTLTHNECKDIGSSSQVEVRHDWMTGCMLVLEDGREIQVDTDSISFVVQELLEEG